MKKIYLVMMLMAGIMSLTACGKTAETAVATECTCKNCKCCTCNKDEEQSGIKVENAEDIFSQEKESEEASESLEIPHPRMK